MTSVRVAAVLLLSSILRTASAAPPPQQFFDLGDFRLESGAVLRDCALGYRTLGTLDANRSNAILFTTWHTGKSEEALSLFDEKGLLDPAGRFIVIVDAIGNGVSCSPSNSTTQHGAAFPAFGIRDMVESEHRLLTGKLGLRHVRAVIGFSMGGAQTLQWIVRHPDFMDAAVAIAGTPQQSSADLLFWRTLERAAESDPAYAHGAYAKNPALPLFQLVFANQFHTPAWRAARTRPDEVPAFIADTIAEPGPDAVDANDSLWQIRALIGQDVSVDGSLAAAAAAVKARTLVIVGKQDLMVNPKPPLDFAGTIHATTLVLDSDCGHTAMFCEMPRVHAAIRDFMDAPKDQP